MSRRVEAGLARYAMGIFVLFRTNITQKDSKTIPVLNRARRNGSTRGLYSLVGGEWSALHPGCFVKGTP
jgi:hypothetical protein